MRRRFCLGILSSIITILLTLYTSTSASSLETGDIVMSVSPVSQELELQPGKTYKGEINISNIGRLAFKTKASTSPFYVEGENYDPVFSTDSNRDRTKLYNWIKLSEDEFLLNPGEDHTLEFEITVPTDIAPGGQYATIMLLSEGDDASSSIIKTSGQIATILYGHVNGGEARMSGELIDHELPGIWSHSGISVSQIVKNTGNMDFKVQQSMTIKEFFSNREVFGPMTTSADGSIIGTSNSVVLPDTSRMNVLAWSDTPKLGLFEVTQTISFLDQNYTFEQVVLVCPIWLIAGIIVVILFIIFRIIFKTRSKKDSQEKLTP